MNKAEWDLFKEYIQDKDAYQFVYDVWWLLSFIDDVADNDCGYKTDKERVGQAAESFTLMFFNLPLNPFFQNNAVVLGSLMRQYCAEWKLATNIELECRDKVLQNKKNKKDQPEHDPDEIKQNLMLTYNLKNFVCHIVCMVVDILNGRQKRDEFMERWMMRFKKAQSFEEYCEKVTAEKRPIKERGK